LKLKKKLNHKIMSSNKVILRKFGNIALSFSGGGYRASAFHLGSLDLLQKVGLLEQVTMLSTVSGGTITGAKYVCALGESIKNNKPDFYEDFFDELSLFLLNERLPDLWLEKLNSSNNPDSPSLIQIAAQAYHDRIFKQIKFDLLLEYQSKLHLKEIIFNTTELRTGIDFRFRIGEKGLIGNGNLPISRKLLKHLRIADVVAASSCFPGGFEPLIFPNDFFDSREEWQKISEEIIIDLKQRAKQPDITDDIKKIILDILQTIILIDEEPLPLVDAGIYDNLGVEAILLANNRLKKKGLLDQQIDTLIISDTDNIGLSQDPLRVDEKQSLLSVQSPIKGNRITRIKLKHIVFTVKLLLIVFAISSLLFVLSACYALFSFTGFGIDFFLKIWGAILSIILTLGITKIEKFIRLIKTVGDNKDNSHQSPNLLKDALKEVIVDWNIFIRSIGDLSIVAILNMMSRRLGSLSPLFIAFLKGQRRKTYTYIQELQKTDSSKLVYGENSFKAINNFILEVNRFRKSPNNIDNIKLPECLIPSQKMDDISILAAQTSTTLWFDTDNKEARKQIENLIACGQFTLCFKLLEMIEEVKSSQGELSPDMDMVNNRLTKAWQQFLENPHAWVGINRSKSLSDYQKNYV
jgi:hypothetical protein